MVSPGPPRAGEVGARHKLGLMYESGEGVPKNEREAEKWYREAVEAVSEGCRAGRR